MAIYQSTKTLPYVYRVTHKITKQFYIGYQFANTAPSSSSLGVTYFTSSNTIKQLGFDNFELEIMAEFFTPEDAYAFEQETILENLHNPLILNKQCFPNGKFVWHDTASTWERTPEYIKKMSEGVKRGLATASAKMNRSKANTGKNNPRALTVVFQGIEYPSQKDAIEATGISKYLMNRHPEYRVIGPRSQRV